MPIRSHRVNSPPQLNSVASVASDVSSAVAARRAMAAQELKNALEAQMQAKMMTMEFAHYNDKDIKGDSSQLTDHGTGSLMDFSASNLVRYTLLSPCLLHCPFQGCCRPYVLQPR